MKRKCITTFDPTPVTPVKDKFFKCDQFLMDGNPCPHSYYNSTALGLHIDRNHSDDPVKAKRMKINQNLHQAARNTTTSIRALGTLLAKVGAELKEIPKGCYNKDNPIVDLLLKMNNNMRKKQTITSSYHACDILLIPPQFYKEGVSVKKLIEDNFMHKDFKLYIFHDSSKTSGPCQYHTKASWCSRSLVYKLALQGYKVFCNNREYCSEILHEKNKYLALYDQMTGQCVAYVRKLVPKTETRKKVQWLNRYFGGKGCQMVLEDDDLIECIAKAYEEGIPSFIKNSDPNDWAEYDIHKFLVENGREDVAEMSLDDEPQFEFFDDDETRTGSSLSMPWDESFKLLVNVVEKVNNYNPVKPKKVLEIAKLVLVMLGINGPSTVKDMMAWIESNFRQLEVEHLYETLRCLLTNCSFFTHHKSDTKPVKWLLEPNDCDEMNMKLQKWLQTYKKNIKQQLIHPELWTSIVGLRLDKNKLTQLYLERQEELEGKGEREINDLKDHKIMKTVLKCKTVLPARFLVAEALKFNGNPMSKVQILDFLSANVLESALQLNLAAMEIHSSNYFHNAVGGPRLPGSWTFINDPENVSDLAIWKKIYGGEIAKRITSNEFREFILGYSSDQVTCDADMEEYDFTMEKEHQVMIKKLLKKETDGWYRKKAKLDKED